MHKDTRECVAVKMVNVDDSGEGLTQDNLKKEVPGGSGGGGGDSHQGGVTPIDTINTFATGVKIFDRLYFALTA